MPNPTVKVARQCHSTVIQTVNHVLPWCKRGQPEQKFLE